MAPEDTRSLCLAYATPDHPLTSIGLLACSARRMWMLTVLQQAQTPKLDGVKTDHLG